MPASSWDYPMVSRLFMLDGRIPPAMIDLSLLDLLSTEFPSRRVAREALAVMEADAWAGRTLVERRA